MAAAADQFAKAVIAAGLASTDEIKSLWSELPPNQRPKDAEAFAKLLVTRGLLKKFQALELLAGSDTPLLIGVKKERRAGGAALCSVCPLDAKCEPLVPPGR